MDDSRWSTDKGPASGARSVRAAADEPAAHGDAVVPPVEDWQRAADQGADLRAAHARVAPPFQPASAGIARELLSAFIEWARDGLPNEACGLLAGLSSAEDGAAPTRFIPLRNAAASPYRYLIDPDEQLRVMLEIDDAEEVIWGICHSHVSSPPEPSATDVGLALYPDALYLICSLAAEPPVVRAWSIRGGAVFEVVLEPI